MEQSDWLILVIGPLNNKINNNFLDCDWFKKTSILFSTNSIAKLLSDSLLLDSLL